MFVQRAIGEVTDWYVVFSKRDQGRLWNFLIRGKFKHVWAAGYCAEAGTLLILDWTFTDFSGVLIPAHHINEASKLALDPEDRVLWMRRRERKRPGIRFLCCTTFIRQLLGLGGGSFLFLSPDRLYHDMLAAGALEIEAQTRDIGVTSHGSESVSRP